MKPDTSLEEWTQIRAMFDDLADLDEERQSERLAFIRSTDPQLASKLAELLAADADVESALAHIDVAIARSILIDDRSEHQAEPDPLKLVGRTVSHFRVIEPLAAGGMGIVYRAEDTKLQRTVALKFPLPTYHFDRGTKERFLREARSAAALNHNNICSIYEIGETDNGELFLAMPLYRGETLKARLERGGMLEPHDAIAITKQIALGVSAAHNVGIVHRDVKPANVMLLPDGTVKVLDFGLAKVRDLTLSAPSTRMGTVAYMSPEQIQGHAVDGRTDLWSIGVILYEMLGGRRPFAGDYDVSVAHAILHAQPIGLSTLRSDLTPQLEALVSRLLSKDPAARYASAEEVVSVLAEPHTGDAQERRRAEYFLREIRITARLTHRRILPLIDSGMRVGVVLAGIGVLASAIWLHSPPTLIRTGKLAAHDTIVLADFEVAGPDSSSAAALTALLRREFDDSKAVSLMSVGEVSSALKRMRLDAGTPITAKVAVEIAQREDKRAVLVPTVTPLSSKHVITLRLIESATGNELTSVIRTAADPERELPSALAEAGQALRRTIGESSRRAESAPSSQRRLLTTTSLEAARLMFPRQAPRSVPERIAAARAAIRRDSAFAYAWMSIGNMLSWTHYRSAALDTAFTMANQFRDNATLWERAQVSSMYLSNVLRDRRGAVQELELALQPDTTIHSAVPLNITEDLIDSRQFERAEQFSRRIEQWKNVGERVTSALVRAQLAQGKYAAAESTANRRRSLPGTRDRGSARLELLVALTTLRVDSATAILKEMPNKDGVMTDWAGLYRLRRQFDDAHHMEDVLDSTSAAIAAAAGARFDPTAGRALQLAREALWLEHDTAAAIAALDQHWRSKPRVFDIQDRIDGMKAGALYAAAGMRTKARDLVTASEAGADTIAKRGIYEYRQAALGEIALADRKFSDAMRFFRASDLAADGLPTSACSVCVLPYLARVADAAGWSDSARVFWEDYVSRPAISRLASDQWFLPTAYGRLATLGSQRSDSATAAYRSALAGLRARIPLATPSHR